MADRGNSKNKGKSKKGGKHKTLNQTSYAMQEYLQSKATVSEYIAMNGGSGVSKREKTKVAEAKKAVDDFNASWEGQADL